MDITALFKLSYGMFAVASALDGKPFGCIANTVIQSTSENPTFIVCLNKNNYTTEIIKKTGRVAVSVLSEDSDPAVIGALGYSSGREKDKFEGLSYDMRGGLPVIDSNCCSYLAGDVVSEFDAETHVIFFVRIKEAENLTDSEPMTYSYFHRVIKGKAPKNAPTYVEEKKESAEKFVCSICGYVAEGYSELPDGFTCPVCGMDKDFFRKEA